MEPDLGCRVPTKSQMLLVHITYNTEYKNKQEIGE